MAGDEKSSPTPSLTVWRFPTPLGVESAELRLKSLEEQKAIVVHDYATVIWFDNEDHPRVHRQHSRGKAAARGTFWGALLGTVFLAPVAGAAAGAAVGAVAHRMRDVGLGEKFLAEVRSQITPGTSALFVLSSDAKLDDVRRVFLRDHDATLIHAELSPEARERLKALHDPDLGVE
jgi:uncharacterized membrane protein